MYSCYSEKKNWHNKYNGVHVVLSLNSRSRRRQKIHVVYNYRDTVHCNTVPVISVSHLLLYPCSLPVPDTQNTSNISIPKVLTSAHCLNQTKGYIGFATSYIAMEEKENQRRCNAWHVHPEYQEWGPDQDILVNDYALVRYF